MRSASHGGTRPPCSGKSANPERFICHYVLKLKSQKSNTLILIGVFKLLKGFALLTVAFGALRFLHRDVSQTLEHWINVLRIDPENHYVHRLLARALNVNPHQLKALSIGTFIYSAIFLTEGSGLLLRKRWAEYFTIISTGALIPLEVYELVKHITPIKIIVMIVNIAIVVYLVLRLRSERR
jgi:uncharacterized membrane protein (DUF2068 family)